MAAAFKAVGYPRSEVGPRAEPRSALREDHRAAPERDPRWAATHCRSLTLWYPPSMSPWRLLFFVLLAPACSRGERPATIPPAASSVPPKVSGVVQVLVEALRAESPRCRVKTEDFGGGVTQIDLGDTAPPATKDLAPAQVPTQSGFTAQPFVPEAEAAARRASEAKQFAACMANTGPGPRHKGLDVHAESCSLAFSDPGGEAPDYHYRRELSINFPRSFRAPAACEAAVARLPAELVAYALAP